MLAKGRNKGNKRTSNTRKGGEESSAMQRSYWWCYYAVCTVRWRWRCAVNVSTGARMALAAASRCKTPAACCDSNLSKSKSSWSMMKSKHLSFRSRRGFSSVFLSTASSRSAPLSAHSGVCSTRAVPLLWSEGWERWEGWDRHYQHENWKQYWASELTNQCMKRCQVLSRRNRAALRRHLRWQTKLTLPFSLAPKNGRREIVAKAISAYIEMPIWDSNDAVSLIPDI